MRSLLAHFGHRGGVYEDIDIQHPALLAEMRELAVAATHASADRDIVSIPAATFQLQRIARGVRPAFAAYFET